MILLDHLLGKPCEGPDPVRISLENLFCAGAQKHGLVRPNSPDKALLCLKIWDAVHAHHKEKTHGLGHHACRRSIYDKRRRKRSSKRNWKERRWLHSALWQCERHTTLKQLLGRICVVPSSFDALWVMPLYSAKVRKGSSWLPDMQV